MQNIVNNRKLNKKQKENKRKKEEKLTNKQPRLKIQ